MRWERDKAVDDLIKYFEQPDIVAGGYMRLASKPQELRVIQEQIRKSREDFSYFARNFLFINDAKNRRVLPFKLFESQELLLDRIMELKRKGRPQKLLICKARQLGCSTLIEGLLTWRTVLFQNVNGLIVSSTPSHGEYLFQMLQFSYDRLPWWMKPMTMSRKISEGMLLENPDHDTRNIFAGLNSKIVVQAANQLSGVGEGRTITACHMSEVSAWTDKQARDIIEGDLGNALAQTAETIAIIETTPRGIGNFFHKMWVKSCELGDRADFQPVFLGWWFEKNRVTSLPSSKWKPEREESEMRERVQKEWTRCTHKPCGRYHETMWGGKSIDGEMCPSCGIGKMLPFHLSDEQLHWMELRRVNAQKDMESLKTLRQEMGSNSEECFVLSGQPVFPQECIDQVIRNLEDPKIRGFFDKHGNVHGVEIDTGKCYFKDCNASHLMEQAPLDIYRLPQNGAQYVIGVDVAAGFGERDSDYSVAFVNKIGGMHQPDEHVATFRSNNIDPVEFARFVTYLGYMYNDALLAIENNRYETTLAYCRQNYNYPNIYRPRLESGQSSIRWGWNTNAKTKPKLWTTGVAWLRHHMWIVRSKNLYREMLTFQKEDELENKTGAHEGSFDDEMIAALLSLFCAHECDWSDTLNSIPVRRYQSGDPDAYMWTIVCRKCGDRRGVPSPEGVMFCMACMSRMVHAEKNSKLDQSPDLWAQLEHGRDEPVDENEIDYELI